LLDRGLVERAASGDNAGTTGSRRPPAGAVQRALPLWANAEQEVRTAMGGKLTADLHGTLDRRW
jgi:hypothetical protein